MKRLSLLAIATLALCAQGPPPRRPGGFVPGQQRPPEDPAQVERGKAIYGLSCRGCHGADLRGGDMGGPNLLRSMLSLSDRKGENIIPVIQGSLQAGGMPAIPLPPSDAQAVAAYVRSVLSTIGGQGMPPSATAPPSILVGNAEEGKAFFAAKCTKCHSAAGDLKDIATRIADPKTLQNTWVAGASRARRASGVTATITPRTGAPIDGKLLRIDNFFVTLELADGSVRTFRRDGETPRVDVHDPLAGHRELLPVYSDKNVHDVTAFLVTLK